jgi:hypothetical protein
MPIFVKVRFFRGFGRPTTYTSTKNVLLAAARPMPRSRIRQLGGIFAGFLLLSCCCQGGSSAILIDLIPLWQDLLAALERQLRHQHGADAKMSDLTPNAQLELLRRAVAHSSTPFPLSAQPGSLSFFFFFLSGRRGETADVLFCCRAGSLGCPSGRSQRVLSRIAREYRQPACARGCGVARAMAGAVSAPPRAVPQHRPRPIPQARTVELVPAQQSRGCPRRSGRPFLFSFLFSPFLLIPFPPAC